MLAQVEGVGQAGRVALEFERPGEKNPRQLSTRCAWSFPNRKPPLGMGPFPRVSSDGRFTMPSTPNSYFLVALSPVGDLLLCAKHLFIAAMAA